MSAVPMVSFVVPCLHSDSFVMSGLPNLSHRVSLVYLVLAYQVCSVETVLCVISHYIHVQV